MRKILWVSLCLLLISPVFASLAIAQQTAAEDKAAADKATDDAVQLLRQDIRSERKQLVVANLPLTGNLILQEELTS
jgi:mannose/cellobiose epimerase-like protein (N-acyl-D-glucosamine 2-epimerase family)